MAATQSTNNKIRNLRMRMYWLAQYQKCPHCKKPLVTDNVNNPISKEIDDLTVEHVTGSYDHKQFKEKYKKNMMKRNASPNILMHSTCHKSMTALQNGLGRNK